MKSSIVAQVYRYTVGPESQYWPNLVTVRYTMLGSRCFTAASYGCSVNLLGGLGLSIFPSCSFIAAYNGFPAFTDSHGQHDPWQQPKGSQSSLAADSWWCSRTTWRTWKMAVAVFAWPLTMPFFNTIFSYFFFWTNGNGDFGFLSSLV